MVEKESGEVRLEQNSLEKCFANYHAKELEQISEVLRIIVCRKNVWIKLSVLLSLCEISVLCVEYLSCEESHEFFEKPPTIKTIFDLEVLVYELYLISGQWIDTFSNSGSKSIFEEVFTPHLYICLRLKHRIAIVFSLHDVAHMREDFCSDSEFIDVWNIH